MTMGLSHAAIIVIVLLCAISVVAIAAGIFSFLGPNDEGPRGPSMEQQSYMRSVRLRYLDLLLQESAETRKNLSR